MIKYVWSILCQRAVVDSQSNNLSLFDVLERLEVNAQAELGKSVPQTINLPVQYEIVSLWSYEGLKKDTVVFTRIDFINPSNSVQTIIEKELVLLKDKKRMRDIMRIQGLPIQESGDYVFRVMAKFEKTGKYKTLSELPLEIAVNRSSNLN